MCVLVDLTELIICLLSLIFSQIISEKISFVRDLAKFGPWLFPAVYLLIVFLTLVRHFKVYCSNLLFVSVKAQ